MAMNNGAVGLIEQINASSNLYNVASTAYGECLTDGDKADKVVSIEGFKYIEGVTIHVKFKNANSAANPTLNVSSEGKKPIVLSGATANGVTAVAAGNDDETTGWPAGAVVSFTYDGTNWVRDRGYNTNTTYTFDGTYNSSTNKVATVSTVTNAINALDVDNATSGSGTHITGFGKGKTLATLTQTNGKIGATFQDIQITESQVTNLTTHLGEKAPIASPTFTGTVTLPGAPTSDLHAATKKYVDDKTAALSGAMHFKGTTTTEMTDGRPTAAVTINNASYTPSAGDVVIYNDSEFVWTGSAWERLGRDSSWALDSAVIKKSEFTAVGQLIYGTGSGTYNFLSGNIDATEKVLLMKGDGTTAAAPSWSTLGINPSKTKAVTAVSYASGTTASGTGTWPTVNKGSGVSITGISSIGSAASASVTDAILTITNGTAPEAATPVTVPKLNDISINTTSAKWPELSITKNTDFLTGASITYT